MTGRFPPVLTLLTKDEVYRAAHTGPAWNRAHHDVAADRHWGLRDYLAAAEVREYTQGEASGDRPASPPGPGAADAARYFDVVAPRWLADRLVPSELYEMASAEPAASRAESSDPDDLVLGWPDYLRAAAIREATQGEAPGDRAASPAGPGATEAARYFETAVPHWTGACRSFAPMYAAASAEPAQSRAEPALDVDAALGWADYLRSAAIRQTTQGEGDADSGPPAPTFDLDTEIG